MALFGLPFFLVGIGVIFSPLFDVAWSGGKTPPILFTTLFGTVFATIGGGLIFGRTASVFNKGTGTFLETWGLLSFALKTDRYRIDEISHIEVTREIRRSDKSAYTVYPVYLILNGNSDTKVNLGEDRSFEQSRSLYESVSKFLEVDVHDKSWGSLDVRKAGTLDQSISELKETERVSKSRLMKSTETPIASGVRFEIPAPRPGLMEYGALIVTAIFWTIAFGSFGVRVLSDTNEGPLTFRIFASIFILLFFGGPLVPLFLAFNRALTRYVIEITRSKMNIASYGLLRTVRMELDIKEIEELKVSREQYRDLLVARTDSGSFTFGLGLSKEELAYIKSKILQTVR